MWFHEEGVENAYKYLLVVIALGVVINFVMNLYWASIIVNTAIKVCFKGGSDAGALTQSKKEKAN